MKTKTLLTTALMTCVLAVVTTPALAHYNIRPGGGQGVSTNSVFSLNRKSGEPNVSCAETTIRTQKTPEKVERVEELLLEFKPFKKCKARFTVAGSKVQVAAEIKINAFRFGLKRGVAGKEKGRWKEIEVRIIKGSIAIRVEVAGLKCQIVIAGPQKQLKRVEWQNKGGNVSRATVNVQGITFTSSGGGCSAAGVEPKGEEARFKGEFQVKGVEHQ